MIGKLTDKELTELCVQLLSKTYLDLGQHNVDAKMKVLMAQSLCFDLKHSFSNLLWKDIQNAFWNHRDTCPQIIRQEIIEANF